MPVDLDDVLAAAAVHLGPVEGEPLALDGGITNRNFRVVFAGEPFVVRLCAPNAQPLGIDRESEHLACDRASTLGIGPAVVLRLPDSDVLVTRWASGVAQDVESVARPFVLRGVAESLRAFHATGPLPAVFDPYALAAEQAVLHEAPPDDLDELLALGARIRDAVAGHPEHAPCPCHDDLLPANVLVDPAGDVCLVDWEYAGMNDPFFDLGNLAQNAMLDDARADVVLAAYFGEPPTPRRQAALRLLRIVSDLREALWGVAQTALSDLEEVDYDRYAAQHLDRLRAAAADPRLEEDLARAQAP